jgi:NAD(P)-dependent dehydrogenase (short-subunit alcohol dehydrogenase family)
LEGIRGGVAVVTGGGRGIGASIARGLAEAGASVCVTARTEREITVVARAIREAGGRAEAVVCDVTREDDVRRLFEEAEGRLGKVSLLVNNAGNAPIGPTAEFSLEDWSRCIGVNLTGAFLCSREAFRRMPAHGGGAIVNISSGAGKHGHAGWAAYCAAKSGLHGLARALSEEGVDLNIRVNTVCPGGTRTQMRRDLFGDEPEGSILDPEDVTRAVLFLLSDAAREVRAAELDVRKPKKKR